MWDTYVYVRISISRCQGRQKWENNMITRTRSSSGWRSGSDLQTNEKIRNEGGGSSEQEVVVLDTWNDYLTLLMLALILVPLLGLLLWLQSVCVYAMATVVVVRCGYQDVLYSVVLVGRLIIFLPSPPPPATTTATSFGLCST